ncbi:ParB/RepB/Spo0J family partition protein [Litorimonas taeanensis]|uniref:ParB/RepB/Spo0J family partition protein n=1 Tax=Litorimonas taeanensis TaxID=568099 RepID=A0A420WE12_9PROT|nr:ParB/RepB/Spo0J family partition protein [Litorimonas taeanensis]RKQ69226.1 ParB/RepB/Spo0J family partition protein [Litorimonas taeanensis]
MINATTLLPLKSLTAETSITLFKSKPRTDIKELIASISTDGLFNPLIVIKKKNKYEVLDGKKRLRALKALAKSPRFTRALHKIPCVITEVDALQVEALQPSRPSLMREAELAHAVLSDINMHKPWDKIAKRFDCDIKLVSDISTLPRLNPKVLKCFNDAAINLDQAAALATIPNPKAQWELLLQLGPFVSNSKIIEAIKSGETVIELPDDNILIVPSRNPEPDSNFGRSNSVLQDEAFTQPLAA